MVPVALEHTGQCVAAAARGRLGQKAPVGKLGPDEQAYPVRGSIVARVGHLDVNAQAVQAHGFGFTELAFDEFIGGRGSEAIRVVILVQGGAQINGPAIEQDLPAARLDRPETELGFAGIEHIA